MIVEFVEMERGPNIRCSGVRPTEASSTAGIFRARLLIVAVRPPEDQRCRLTLAYSRHAYDPMRPLKLEELI